MKSIFALLVLLLAILLLAACAPCVEVYHSPVVAKSNEQVTFTATVCGTQSPANVELLVNAAKVKTCTGLTAGQTCTYTGGPYAAYQGTTVSYLANASRVANGKTYTSSRGYYYFAVTDADYNWSKPAIPAGTPEVQPTRSISSSIAPTTTPLPIPSLTTSKPKS